VKGRCCVRAARTGCTPWQLRMLTVSRGMLDARLDRRALVSQAWFSRHPSRALHIHTVHSLPVRPSEGLSMQTSGDASTPAAAQHSILHGTRPPSTTSRGGEAAAVSKQRSGLQFTTFAAYYNSSRKLLSARGRRTYAAIFTATRVTHKRKDRPSWWA